MRDITIKKNETVNIINEELFITLLDISNDNHQVTFTITAPGFEQAQTKIERKDLGETVSFNSTYKIKIQTLDIAPSYPEGVDFRIYSFGPSGDNGKVVQPVSDVTVSKNNTASIDGGKLTIYIQSFSSQDNMVNALIKSPSGEDLTIANKQIGDLIRYPSKPPYDILIAGYGYGSGFSEGVRFIVSKWKE